jgi:hypothetical protein
MLKSPDSHTSLKTGVSPMPKPQPQAQTPSQEVFFELPVQGTCSCVTCPFWSICHIQEYEVCPTYQCLVVYDPSRRPLSLDLVQLIVKLHQAARKARELADAYAAALRFRGEN